MGTGQRVLSDDTSAVFALMNVPYEAIALIAPVGNHRGEQGGDGNNNGGGVLA